MIHLICPFCKQKLMPIHPGSMVKTCDNHDPIVAFFIEHSVYICKDQYEISFDTLRNRLRLIEHTKEAYDTPCEYAKLSKNGYCYIKSKKPSITIANDYNVTPENFDFYLDKLKILTLFI